MTAAPGPSGAVRRATDALDRAVYCLDRSLAPRPKIKAFRTARTVIADLDDATLDGLVSAGSVTSLEGIGRSTGSVIIDAVTRATGGYLDRLDTATTVTIGEGATLRPMLRGDCHLHTTWSDGGASIREMAVSARSLGHEYLVITDHSPRLTVAHGLSPERLRQQREEIDRVQAELPDIRILRGTEVDILEDGSLDLPDDILADLDVVVASVHSKLAMPSAEMTPRMVRAVANPHVDILGHCTGRQIVGTGRAPSRFDADMVFAACARFGTAVEINCRPERQDPPDDLLAIALEWDCRVTIDTDAHAPGHLEWQASGCDKAVAHGIAPERILNTRSADDLLAALG
ncbi:MAG: PHP domain-containing protein [Microthrixaceae bacterium]